MALLNNRYRLEEPLGQGGMGVVYRAFDEELQRPVAIKRLSLAGSGADQRVERLRREAALLRRLAHPNIVACFDLGEEAGDPYLVLEYVLGNTLRTLLEAQAGPLPVELAVHILTGVLAALAAAHQTGVIHRDLKPENIMLVDVDPEDDLELAALRPVVKVMDFGLAYLQGDVRITDEDLVAGTALYLAPEAALGQTVDRRTDLYAAGVILYEMITGRPPFPGDDPLVVISQHLHAAPISPRWHQRTVPPALATITLKLLAKDPAERFQSAAEVLEALESAPLTSQDAPPPTRTSVLEAIARGRLVGREEELAVLRQRIDAMRAGEGGAIFVEGGPGIGKSRLAREAGVYARLTGVQVFTGHYYDPDLASPYQPFIEIVRAYVQGNFEPGSTGHVPAGLAAELVRLVPGLEAHLGQPPAAGEASGSPAEARLRLFEAVTTLLAGGPVPVLLVLENLQRASPPDLALLVHLVQTGLARRRLLLIATYQGGYEQAEAGELDPLAEAIGQLERAGLASHLSLAPLSPAGVVSLVETLLEGEVAPDFGQAIYRLTEGNPFFVEEILKALIEEGGIFRDQGRGRWDSIDPERLEIPASLQAVINRRLARLSQRHQRLLSVAALLGREFRRDVLLAVSEVDEETLEAALTEAERMQLIRRRRARSRARPPQAPGETAHYIFEHGLICQTLAERLPPHRWRRLHRQIAHGLERLNQRRGQQLVPPDELAFHFSMARGDDLEKAISYNLAAVDNALRVYASEGAVRHYEFILDLLEDDEDVPRRAWILEQMGDLYFQRTRQMVDAIAAYERAIEIWQATSDPDWPALIRLYRKVGEVARFWQGPAERLDAYLARASQLLDQREAAVGQTESLERARLLAAMAFNLHARPESAAIVAQALKLAQAAADLAARLDAADEESAALDAMQRIYRSQGNLAAARQIGQRRLALIPHLSNPAEQVDTYLGASQTSWEMGNLDQATQFCHQALEVARQTDNVGGQWQALRRLVMFHLQWGKLAAAATYAAQGVALGPRAGLLTFGEPVEALFHTHLAILHTLQGQAEAAAAELAELDQLYPTPAAPPHRFARGWLHYEREAWLEARPELEHGQAFSTPLLPLHFDLVLRLEVYGHLGDEAALAEIGPAAEAEAYRWNLPYLLAIFHRGYGAFYTGQNAWTEAEAAFRRALAATHGTAFWYQDARTWLDYGRLLARRGRPGDATLARDFLNEAQRMFTAFGAQALAEKAWVEETRLAR